MLKQRYDFVRRLASGQMSDVWLALDRKTSMQVAVKIMKPGSDEARNTKAIERFHREIDIAQELRHPQILPLLDYGLQQENDGQRPFLVSPYIPEGSLVSLLQLAAPWQRWSLPQVADAVLQAAECLWFLHTRTPPIVHEDVKPGNFLYRSINSTERAVLLYLFDFGISRRKSPAFSLASEAVGTLEFMAPEQIQQRVDCASDQYSLAVMACLLLTGHYPIHVEQRAAYIEAQQFMEPLPPSVLYPERISSSEVDAIILRALAKEPAQRFPTILTFARELQQAIQSYARQQQGPLFNLPTEPVTTPPPLLQRSAQQPAGAFMSSTQRVAFAFDAPDTHDGRLLDDPLPARPARSVAPASTGAPSANTLNLVRLPLREPVPLRQELPARARILCWSPDGTLLACVLYGMVVLYQPAMMTLQMVTTSNSQRVTACCWSPMGNILALAGNRQICFWDAVSQTLLPSTLACPQSSLEGLDWSAQGVLACWQHDQVSLRPLSPASMTLDHGQPVQYLSTENLRCGNPGTLRFSPDGRYLAAGASNGELMYWQLDRAQPRSLRLDHQDQKSGQKIQSLAWTPDSTMLFVARKDCCLTGWQIQTRQVSLQWSNLPAMPRTLAISLACQLALASSEPRLLLGPGTSQAVSPTHMLPGQLLVSWSSNGDLATLDEQNERHLLIWHGAV